MVSTETVPEAAAVTEAQTRFNKLKTSVVNIVRLLDCKRSIKMAGIQSSRRKNADDQGSKTRKTLNMIL